MTFWDSFLFSIVGSYITLLIMAGAQLLHLRYDIKKLGGKENG